MLTQTVDFQGMRQGGIRLKKEKDIEGIRRAGSLVLETLDMVEEKYGLVSEQTILTNGSMSLPSEIMRFRHRSPIIIFPRAAVFQ